MKQICVIGLGQFGTHLAQTLARMKCEVLAIDMNDARVTAVRDDVHHAVVTDVRDFEALKSVVSSDIDEAIVSLGENMEASVLCTLHLSQIGVKKIRAQAAGKDHASILKAVGASEVIFPEKATAERIAHRITNPDLLDYLPLSNEYRVVEVSVPDNFVGQTLASLHLRKKYRVLVIAIKKPDAKQIEFMPAAESELKRGNTLVIMGREDDIARLTTEKKG